MKTDGDGPTESCPKCEQLKIKLAEVTEGRDDLQALFDIMWDANQRAIKRWQEAHKEPLIWPDHADMVVWMLGEMERLEARLQKVLHRDAEGGDNLRRQLGDVETLAAERSKRILELEARCEFWEGQYRLAEDSRLELARKIRVCNSSLADACIYLPGLKEIIERIEQENESLHARCKELTDQSLRRLSGLAKCGIERDELHARCKGMEEALTTINNVTKGYLSVGGLFNPEMMDHQKVGDMILEISQISHTTLATISATSRKRSGTPSPAKEKVTAARSGIYVASRASIPARASMWRCFRECGALINSSWIDEDGEGQTADFSELWTRIVSEIRRSEFLVLYAEPGDFPLKGAFVEAGIAIGMGIPVYVVLPGVTLEGATCRPIGSWIKHPLVKQFASVCEALEFEPIPDTSPALPAEVHPIEPRSERISPWKFETTIEGWMNRKVIVGIDLDGDVGILDHKSYSIGFTTKGALQLFGWLSERFYPVKSPPPSTPNGSGSSDNSQTKGASS